MTCVLRASGSKAAVRKFEKNPVFKNASTFIKGLPINPSKPDGRKYQSSGIGLPVSKQVLWEDLPTQIKQVITFIKKNTLGLESLRNLGFKEIRLDFGVWKRDVWAQYDFFPPELVYLASKFKMGIELSQYHGGENESPKKKKSRTKSN